AVGRCRITRQAADTRRQEYRRRDGTLGPVRALAKIISCLSGSRPHRAPRTRAGPVPHPIHAQPARLLAAIRGSARAGGSVFPVACAKRWPALMIADRADWWPLEPGPRRAGDTETAVTTSALGLILLTGAAVVLAAIVAARVAHGIGLPGLLLFLGLGLAL